MLDNENSRLTKTMNQIIVIYLSIGNRDSNIFSGKVMDLVVTAVVAISIAILTVLAAIITRQKIGKIVLYGLSGLIGGLLIGYLLTPTIISFF
jgi:hypothetical protein